MLFQLAAIASVASVASARKFTVYNGCPFTIWPAIFTSGGTKPSQPTGWVANPYTAVTFDVAENWNGRIWGRRDCDFSSGSTLPNTCLTGGCNGGLLCADVGGTGVPPATLGEWNLNADVDWYDLSHVDGSNLPASITNGGTAGCKEPICKFDLNSQCPGELAIKDRNGWTVGCKSACSAFGTEEACCSGSHSTPETCPISGIPYYDYFKGNCPDAYYSAYDDNSALLTCAAKPNWTITFCPP